jgi:hypothetical protein
VVIDSLRAAAPTIDENTSEARRALDMLGLVSDKTGATFLVLHHEGKPKDYGDARMAARGSSAIQDAAGCVLRLTPGQRDGAPRTCAQTKQPAESEGGGIADFAVVIEDVELAGNKHAGVRVLHQPISARPNDVGAKADQQAKQRADRILALVREHPDCGKRFLRANAGFGAGAVDNLVDLLLEEERLSELPKPRGGKGYRLGPQN